jgi:hypothetical protein
VSAEVLRVAAAEMRFDARLFSDQDAVFYHAVADWLDVMADRFNSRLSSALMQTDDVDKAIRGCEQLARHELAVARAYLADPTP